MSSRTREQPPLTLIALLRRSSRAMVEEITDHMQAAGYPWAPARHYPVFESIDPGGTRITILAARAGITHQSMAQLVDELEQRGIVERVPDPSDRRARLVRLTEEGHERVGVAMREIDKIEARWRALWQDAGLKGDVRGALWNALRAAKSTTHT